MELRRNITDLISEREHYRRVLSGEHVERAAKRLFDILFSLLCLLPVFLLLFPFVCLLVATDAKGGVFFVQRRNGLHNRLFPCIKFRTMVPNAEANTCAATEQDLRVTRVGKILRNTGLDELPQFLNVLRGDMSIVGPRPHMISDNLRFEQGIAGYQRRHQVKPGITGLAQINGYKGPAHDDHSVRQRIRMDLFYAKNHDFRMDMFIVFVTIRQMAVAIYRILRR